MNARKFLLLNSFIKKDLNEKFNDYTTQRNPAIAAINMTTIKPGYDLTQAGI
jgi:hypothetical protein